MLDTLQHVRHATGCWLEITTLLIPGLNDSTPELEAMTRWIADALGPDVPLHFSAFHPAHKLGDLASTPPATLIRARRIAIGNGLHHVYTGNVRDAEGGTTFCPGCQAALIERDWHAVLRDMLTDEGGCPHCGRPIAGRFAPRGERGGGRQSRRMPLRIAPQ